MAFYITFPVAVATLPPEDAPKQRQLQKIKAQQEAGRLKALKKDASN
jgi:hypothetical protein